jgi:GT2 family glycosyltransferase
MSLSTAALITNYNTWLLTNRCVMELLNWSSKSLSEILIVDDASEQAQPDNLSDKVRVVQNSQNQGYVASINIGFRQLHEDVILIFDSDAYPLMDLSEPISQAFADNPKLGALGFQLVDEHGQSTGSSQSEPSAIGLLLGQKLEALYNTLFKPNQSQSICLYSCAIAVRRIAFEEIGGFDEGFDFLDADIDFSIRLREAGWQIQVDSNLLAFHKGGGSFQTTSKRVLRYHRNRWRLLANHGYLSQEWLFKFGLATRHTLEYSLLRIIGKQLILEPTTLEDKLHSRRQLLRGVWSGYGNEY